MLYFPNHGKHHHNSTKNVESATVEIWSSRQQQRTRRVKDEHREDCEISQPCGMVVGRIDFLCAAPSLFVARYLWPSLKFAFYLLPALSDLDFMGRIFSAMSLGVLRPRITQELWIQFLVSYDHHPTFCWQ